MSDTHTEDHRTRSWGICDCLWAAGLGKGTGLLAPGARVFWDLLGQVVDAPHFLFKNHSCFNTYIWHSE